MKQRVECILTLFFLGIIIVPSSVLAVLSSENFVVEGQSVGSQNTTLIGGSASYGTSYETGGLYQVADEVTEEEPDSGGTRVPTNPSGSALGKTDSIKICHQSGEVKFVTLNNVQVFVTLADTVALPEFRGHAGHAQDIIPPFNYDFGGGIKTYAGSNWNNSNRILFNNDCKSATAQVVTDEPVTVPDVPTPDTVVPPKKQVVLCNLNAAPKSSNSRVVYVLSNPPCSVSSDNSVEVENTNSNPDVSALADIDVEPPFGGEAELLMMPITVYMKDENGEAVDVFDAPVTIEISNPKILGLKQDELRILQPSQDGRSWEEVPFEIEGDTLRITINHPGELFVWFIPRQAIAAEETVPLDTNGEPFVSLEIPLLWATLLSYAGLGIGFLTALARLSNSPFSLLQLRRILLEGWNNLIALLTFKKRRRAWGTVYDSATKAPLDPAYVEIFDYAGVKSAEAITDLDGRYGFLVPTGSYTMQVRKTNYSFPSRITALTGQDVIYSKLYFGGRIEVSTTVTHDIPMDPQNFDWNQYEKLRTKQTRFFHFLDPIIVRFLDLVFLGGFLLMIWQFLRDINVMTCLLLACYLVLFAYRFTTGRPILYGAVTEGGKPLAFALVKIMHGDHTILTKVTDLYGRYVAIVAPEIYTVQIEKRIAESQYQPVFKRKIKAKHGIINSRIKI